MLIVILMKSSNESNVCGQKKQLLLFSLEDLIVGFLCDSVYHLLADRGIILRLVSVFRRTGLTSPTHTLPDRRYVLFRPRRIQQIVSEFMS